MKWGKQWVFCQCCGKPFQSSFGEYDGRVCGRVCWGELGLKRDRAIAGKDAELNPAEDQREELSDLEHTQWAHWTRYMLEMLIDKVPAVGQLPEVERWLEQCETPYGRLSEKEKDSDREWADRVFRLIGWLPFVANPPRG